MDNKGSQTYGESVGDDFSIQFKATFFKTDVCFAITEVENHPNHAHTLRNHRRHGRTSDAQFQAKNEDGSQNDIHRHCEQNGHHGLDGIARGTHNAIKAKEDMRDDVTRQDDPHKVAGVGQRAFAGAE